MEVTIKHFYAVARKSDGFFLWFGPFGQTAWSETPDIGNAYRDEDSATLSRINIENNREFAEYKGQLYVKPILLSWEKGYMP